MGGEILRLRCAQSDTGPWARGMGPRMREDNGRGKGAHEGRPYGGRVARWAVGMGTAMGWRGVDDSSGAPRGRLRGKGSALGGGNGAQ